MIDLSERRLLIVECIEQAEDNSGARTDTPQHRQQAVGDGSFHLITREPARNEDPVEKYPGGDVPPARELRDGMRVKPVTAVHNGNGHIACQRLRYNAKRHSENQWITVEKT